MDRHIDAQVFNTPDRLLPGERMLAVVDLGQVWPHVASGWSDFEMLLLIKNCLLTLSGFLWRRGLLCWEESALLRHVVEVRVVVRRSSRFLKQI